MLEIANIPVGVLMKSYFTIGAPILVLLPLPIFYIYERLHALILAARISITLGIMVFFILAIYFLLRYGPSLNFFQKGLVFSAAVLGIIQTLYVQDLLPESIPPSGSVNMWFADGSKIEGYQPVVKWLGKGLSLAYPLQDITTADNYAAKKSIAQTGKVTEIKYFEKKRPVRIAKNFAVSSKGVSLVLVRPKNQAPYAPIRVEIIGTDLKGSIGYKHNFDFPSDAHQKQFWISNSADEAAGISAIDIQISVLSQSETENEVLYVIYEGAGSIGNYLYIIGKLLLIGFSFGGIVYSILICCKGMSFSKQRNLKYAVLPAITLLLPMIIIAYGVGSSNDSFFARLAASGDLLRPLDDQIENAQLSANYDRYWYKSIVLHDVLISDWRETVAVIAKHYTETYTMLPAIIPAF